MLLTLNLIGCVFIVVVLIGYSVMVSFFESIVKPNSEAKSKLNSKHVGKPPKQLFIKKSNPLFCQPALYHIQGGLLINFHTGENLQQITLWVRRCLVLLLVALPYCKAFHIFFVYVCACVSL